MFGAQTVGFQAGYCLRRPPIFFGNCFGIFSKNFWKFSWKFFQKIFPGLRRAICTIFTMPRRDVTYPPFRALPPSSPFRQGQRGLHPLPSSRPHAWEQQTRRWMARKFCANFWKFFCKKFANKIPKKAGGGSEAKKRGGGGCVPKIGLKFPAPLINFIFCLAKGRAPADLQAPA